MAELKPCPFCGEFGDAVHLQKLFYNVSYGDTELTRWKVMCENCESKKSPEWERLCELAEADKEGRIVVLPCKVGDTAWVKDRAGTPREMRLESPDIRFVCTDEDNLCMSMCSRTRDGLCAYRIMNDNSDIGKRVFLTREEAEAALKEVQNG